MKGTHINPYIDQIGLCACRGVDIDYGQISFQHTQVVILYQ